MRATKYNKRITIQRRVKIKNDIGGWSNKWSDLFTCWASILPLSGMKRLEYGRLAFTEAYEVEMRRRSTNPDSECQAIYDGRTFQIASIEPGNRIKLVISR